MLKVEWQYLVPKTDEYRRALAMLPIDTPEYNPDAREQVSIALREILGEQGVGKAEWVGGKHDGIVVFSGHASDIIPAK